MFKVKLKQGELNRFKKEVLQEWNDQVQAKLIALFDKALELQWVQFRPEGYNDDTGQLRSSTGYILFLDGKVIHEKFELSTYGTDRAPGLKEGRDYAFKFLRKSKGFGAVFVAGMDYAGYVQAKSFSVLIHAEMEIDKNLWRELDEIRI